MFCAQDIDNGALIEVAPVIILPKKEIDWLEDSLLYTYYFLWGKQPAIVLGYGSLYNHSESPNATFELDVNNQCVIFKAINDINAMEEITIDYHEGLEDGRLWF